MATALLLVAALVGCSSGSAGDTSVLGPAGTAADGSSDGGTSAGGSGGGADPGSGGSTGGGGTTGSIEWGRCDEPDATAAEQCATFAVPLDHDDPTGPTIELALNLRPATDPDERIGILLVNPGGPGASGIDYARQGPWSSDLLARFDLVGFDPRGVARSTPIDCLADAELEQLFDGPASPDTDAEIRAAAELSARLEAQCAADPIGPHLGTRDVARDMDLIRAAMGEERLSFYGASYGTSIAAAYVDLFPDRVRAVVMDSVVSPTASTAQQATDQAAAFERLLDQFVVWCADRDDACPSDPRASIEALLRRADAEPIDVPEYDGRLSGTLAVLGVITAFYSPDAWEFLGDALKRADDGDVEGIYRLSMFQTERDPQGGYSNLREALISVVCADAGDPLGIDEARALAADLAARYPTFGAAAAWGSYGCEGWPPAEDPMVAPDSATSPTVLIVGTTEDPATPYQGALDMRQALTNSVLFTYEGTGHVAFGSVPCVDAVVEAYLLDLVVPGDGARC